MLWFTVEVQYDTPDSDPPKTYHVFPAYDSAGALVQALHEAGGRDQEWPAVAAKCLSGFKTSQEAQDLARTLRLA